MLTSFEKAMIARLNPWCSECEDYLDGTKLRVKEYPDRLEIFCSKHGNGIPSHAIGSNCMMKIPRFQILFQSKITRFFYLLGHNPLFCGFFISAAPRVFLRFLIVLYTNILHS